MSKTISIIKFESWSQMVVKIAKKIAFQSIYLIFLYGKTWKQEKFMIAAKKYFNQLSGV